MELKLDNKRNHHSWLPHYSRTAVKLSFALNLILVIVTLIIYSVLQPVIPIFYSVSSPEKQLAPKYYLFLLPLLSFIFNLINLILIKLAKKNHLEKTLIKLYAWANLSLQLILTIATFRIILIII